MNLELWIWSNFLEHFLKFLPIFESKMREFQQYFFYFGIPVVYFYNYLFFFGKESDRVPVNTIKI